MPNISEYSARCMPLRMSAKAVVAEQKFINEKLLRDGRATGNAALFQRKNNRKVLASLASLRKYREPRRMPRNRRNRESMENGRGWLEQREDKQRTRQSYSGE